MSQTEFKPPLIHDMSDEMLRARAQLICDRFAKAFNDKAGAKAIKIPVQIEYDLELTEPKVFAMARTTFKGRKIDKQIVMVNMTVFRDHPHEFFNIAFPHEIAHFYQEWAKRVSNLSEKSDHGRVWVEAMQMINQPPQSIFEWHFNGKG